jgi:hypothetical protein
MFRALPARSSTSVMVYASYLVGHIDGSDHALEEVAPKAIRTMESHAYFGPFFARLREELRTMHAAYAQWQSLEVFEPLKKLADDLLKFGGIDIQAKPDGTAYVAFRFTAETIPSAAERMGFLAGRTPSERK